MSALNSQYVRAKWVKYGNVTTCNVASAGRLLSCLAWRLDDDWYFQVSEAFGEPAYTRRYAAGFANSGAQAKRICMNTVRKALKEDRPATQYCDCCGAPLKGR